MKTSLYEKVKKVLRKPLIVHIENVRLALEQWAFIVTYNVMESLLKECTPQASTIEHLNTSRHGLKKLVLAWVRVVGQHLIWLAVLGGIAICLLLPLTLVAVLYAVERLLLLSLRGLTYLRTRR